VPVPAGWQPDWDPQVEDEGADASLAPGVVLSHRYEVVRRIGRGGMGEVYEAFDLALRERVALKVVRPALAGDRVVMDRFQREIQLSRRVTHPNVCRVFDLGRHRDGRRDVTFLTMELLSGETLEARIQRAGRLTAEETLPLVRQVAEALDAAHGVGVVHRDFKPANVMLVPAREGGTRAVVTDFGLARSLEPEADALVLSSGSLVVGTAAYMAPEQADGSDATRASDVYALGVVVYEMVTGQRPHVGRSQVELLMNRLSEAPVAPGLRNPDLPGRWNRVILRCLERDPARRFPTAGEVADGLEEAGFDRSGWAHAGARAADLVQRSFSGPRRRWLAAALAGALVVGTAALRHLDPEGRPGSREARRSVAVLGFRDLAGRSDTGWVSEALTEMFGAELSVGETLRTVPSQNVRRVKAELQIGESDAYDRETLGRLRENLDADVVVHGFYLAPDAGPLSRLRVDVRMQDTATGETLATVSESRSVASILDLVSNAGDRLRGHLGARPVSEEESRFVRASIPTEPRAARLYAEGLSALARFDPFVARGHFEKSLEIEPGHALTHSALAEALSVLGLEREAEASARRAHENSSPLDREGRLLIEGRLHEASFRWKEASETYGVLFGFFPDDLEHGLRLLRAQTRLADPKGAAATLASLRDSPFFVPDDPRIDLAEADVADNRSDFGRALAAAEAAARKGSERRAQLLVSEALLRQARAQLLLGLYDRSEQSAKGARAIYLSLRHPIGVLDAEQRLGLTLFAFGRLEEAIAHYEGGLRKARELGSRRHEVSYLAGLGETYIQRGDVAEAERNLRAALEGAKALGNRHMTAVAEANLAAVLELRGELSAAAEQYESGRRHFEEIGDFWRAAGVSVYLGDVERAAGNVGAARAHGERALAALDGSGDGFYKAWALDSLGTLSLLEGDFPRARSLLVRSMELRSRAKERFGVARSQLGLAAVAVEEGKASEGERLASRAAETFRSAGSKEREAAALEVRARARLAAGRLEEAAADAGRAVALARGTGVATLRFAAATVAARVALSRGEAAEARTRLAAILEEARPTQLETARLDVSLALAEAELATGDAEAARRRLEAVEREARERGLVAVARRAAALRRG
jgi:eukaryotic-like serine/threonine-protein kinase